MAPTTDPPVDAWKGGWYGLARPLPSPNFGRRPAAADVDLIVVHSISLPAGRYGGDEVQRLFTNQLDWNAHPSYASLRGIKVSALCPQGVRTGMLERASANGRAFLMDSAVEPEQVADDVVKGLAEERFLILPHPEVGEYVRRKATDHERWLRGMRRLRKAERL